MLDLLK
jgi:hypothetical protein